MLCKLKSMGRRSPTQPGWMPDEVIRQLYDLGWSNEDIAHANEETTGWHPSPAAMSRKLQRLGLPKRRASHRHLIPWHINPAHAHNQIYYGLMAISRENQKMPLSPQDVFRAKYLRDLLTRRGAPRVVNYDYDAGWSIVPARKTDKDIIRRPSPVEADSKRSGDSPPLRWCVVAVVRRRRLPLRGGRLLVSL